MTADAMTGLGGLFLLVSLLLMRMPAALGLLLVGLALMLLSGAPVGGIPATMLATLDRQDVLAVPLFLFFSHVMVKGAAADTLLRFSQALVGHWPGGLLVAAVAASVLLGFLTTSGVAATAALAALAMPGLLSAGYPRWLVLGLMAGSGTLTLLLPPSMPLMMLGLVMDQPAGDLLIAGIYPGLLLSVLLVVMAMIFGARFGRRHKKMPAPRRREALIGGVPLLLLLGVLVSLAFFADLAAAQLAAIAATLAVLVICGVYRRLPLRQLADTAFESAVGAASLLAIAAGAKALLLGLSVTGFLGALVDLVTGLPGVAVFIVLLSLLVIVLAFLLDGLGLLLVVLPILLPAALVLGLDPVWLAVYFVMLLQAALVLPPSGLNLLIIQGLARSQPAEITEGAAVFLLPLALVALVWCLWPGLPFGEPVILTLVPTAW
ncbi:TRAP transporter large permease subunit [Pannonibacter carbonis]|uniref:TRAP transporter large permease subunit n=1 Tax=Pannonibacter carbonis TaxID=2067569 RepID=UPI000D1117EA|nr:TRAP transporter large permease subunit [Pannonibacter carbonis]